MTIKFNRRLVGVSILLSLALLLSAGLLGWQVASAQLALCDRLPVQLRGLLQKALPDAKILSAKPRLQTMLIYEVQILRDGQQQTVEMFANGELLTISQDMTGQDLPEKVGKAIDALTGQAKPFEVKQLETHAMIAISRLPKPRTTYRADYLSNGQTISAEVDTEGRVRRNRVAHDQRETEIDLEDVPAPARKTILAQAGDNRVREVEVETRDGKTTYEAEWSENGQAVEITVAPDGKLLGLHRGDDDEDDDDDDDDDEDDDDEDDD